MNARIETFPAVDLFGLSVNVFGLSCDYLLLLVSAVILHLSLDCKRAHTTLS